MHSNDHQKSAQINSLPTDLLVQLFSFFTPHEQVCLLAAINRQFRNIVYNSTLDKALSKIIPNQLGDNPVFSKHPIESFKLAHAMRYSVFPIWEDIKEPWMLAAFAGNLAASYELLGQELITRQSEDTLMGTVLFSARGGQTEMLKAINNEHGSEALMQTDSIGHNVLMLACMGLHADCMAWIIQNSTLSLVKEYEVGFMTYSCLDIFKDGELPDYFTVKLALMLTDNFDKINKFKDYSNETVIGLSKQYLQSHDEETLLKLNQQF